MFHRFVLLIIAGLTLLGCSSPWHKQAATPKPVPSEPPTRMEAAAAQDMTIKASPSEKAESIGVLEKGDTVGISNQQGDWLKVTTREGTQGWVRARSYLSIFPRSTQPEQQPRRQMKKRSSKTGPAFKQKQHGVGAAISTASADGSSERLHSPGNVNDRHNTGGEQEPDAAPIVSEDTTLFVEMAPSGEVFIEEGIAVAPEQANEESSRNHAGISSRHRSTPVPANNHVVENSPNVDHQSPFDTVTLLPVPGVDEVPVRTAPKEESAAIATLKSGTTVKTYGKINGWYRVHVKGRFGFLNESFASKTQD